MSNQAVGAVYQTIIEEVINSSRVDFEESGVEESVLEELRKGWQQKLSQLDVATFPWDPKPETAPPAAKAAPAAAAAAAAASAAGTHSQAQFSPQISLPNAASTTGPGQNGVKPEPYLKQENGQGIKQEPGTQPVGVPAYPAYNGMDGQNSVAANRAAQQLQAQYGNRAAGSISAIQDRMGQQAQTQPQAQQQAQAQAQQHAYRQQQPNVAIPQQPQPPNAGGPGPSFRNGQTDGAGDMDSDSGSDDDDDDFEGVLLQRNAAGDVQELGRMDIDRILHKRMAAKAKSMEAGGLMLTLKEATQNQPGLAQSSSTKRKGKGVAAYDGGDDDDEDDEDAINSDLDDPDDGGDDDEVDDEGLGHIMLCMYDKVQRVKNKWKCTLKDGVLTVNGKEYVFHKATGEYEW
ncbi:transcriptional regulator [Paramyrothecium foliicola]|nr:transcriptional regulator [Paramyrothecium foliicola]